MPNCPKCLFFKKENNTMSTFLEWFSKRIVRVFYLNIFFHIFKYILGFYFCVIMNKPLQPLPIIFWHAIIDIVCFKNLLVVLPITIINYFKYFSIDYLGSYLRYVSIILTTHNCIYNCLSKMALTWASSTWLNNNGDSKHS